MLAFDKTLPYDMFACSVAPLPLFAQGTAHFVLEEEHEQAQVLFRRANSASHSRTANTSGNRRGTVRSLDLLGDEDVNHLELATSMGYVLCTNASDFVKLARDGFEHARIIFGQQEKHSIGHWVKRLEQLHSTRAAEDFVNHVEYL